MSKHQKIHKVESEKLFFDCYIMWQKENQHIGSYHNGSNLELARVCFLGLETCEWTLKWRQYNQWERIHMGVINNEIEQNVPR